ncbi:hypothetical protein AN958_07060 [Leucoagaricus sp. SymC.cos]|nr:hypothetical protein AN958_07060 [Leucoagaricus sp. SymC.cos]
MLNSPIITDALVKLFYSKDSYQALMRFQIWGILGAVCNVLIASYMIHFLWKQFKDISPESQACFTRANRFLLETGLLTGLSLSKIYGTSLLVMLNNRMAILDGRNRGDPAFEIPSFGRSRDSNTSGMISEIVFARNRRSVTARFQLSTVVRFTNTDNLYYLAFPHDKRLTKVVVYFVYIIGTLQSAFTLRDFYTLFCTVDGNQWLEDKDVHRFGFMWLTIPVCGSLITTVVQFLYAHRIYTISEDKLLSAVVAVLASLQFIIGIITAGLVYRPGKLEEVAAFPALRQPGYILLLVGVLLGAVCDIVIAIVMSAFVCLRIRLSSAAKSTQVLVTKTKRLIFETGIMTAITAIAYATLSFINKENWYMIPALALGKLSGNAMLVLLNNRFTILGGRNSTHPDFDIPSYRQSIVTESDSSPAVSRGIAFAHSRPTDTPDFDIPSYRQSIVTESDSSPAVSRGIAFAHSRPTDTTFISAGVHTVDLASPRLDIVSEESNQPDEKVKKPQPEA